MIVIKPGELPEDWTEEQNAIFTKVYKFMIANQGAFVHPAAPAIGAEHWQTICHNASFVAAELSLYDSLRILDLDTEETIAESPGTLNS